MRYVIAAILSLSGPVLLALLLKTAFAETTRNATLSLIRWQADNPAKPRDSVYRLLDWCCDHPTAKTTRNLLRHLRRIINDRPAYMAIAAVISSDVSSRERHRSVERLIEELHDDATTDIDAADRMEIFALLL